MPRYPKNPASNNVTYDHNLIWLGLILLGFGLVMIYSASIAIADNKYSQNYHFLVRHAIYVALGIVSAFFVAQIPLRFWQKIAPLMFLIGLVSLFVVLIHGIGVQVLGSRRWINLIVVQIQPSEFMKFFTALYVADFATRKAHLITTFKHGFLPILLAMVLVGVLLLFEPDFGAFIVIASIAFGTLFLGGMNLRILAILIPLSLIGVASIIFFSDYRWKRVLGFMDPWSDPFGSGYQLTHALIAIGRGGLFGVGLGNSVEKLHYLPETHTDFILAIIAEELGFCGVMAVIGLLSLTVFHAFRIAKNALSHEQIFSTLFARGIGIWVAIQSIINIGVNLGVLPTKGLTLPFLSFGGSSILAFCLSFGVLLRIDYENKQLDKGIRL